VKFSAFATKFDTFHIKSAPFKQTPIH